MSDVASLIIRVTTSGARAATGELGGLAKAAAGVAVALVSLEAASQVFNTLVSTQRNFDKLNSSLITMTGSADNAAKAFGVLQQFAKETPYGLNQAVEGFTKLVALGLNPSKAALISYGNTAAAMGKDLNQMIEAVADAATGEFERLKEFGIKASQQGDKVSFTFQGVKTTVKKNSEEIQKYLLNIGDTNFAGAMEERSKTLDGALSSLSDTTEGLFLSIAQSGFGDAVAEQVRNAEDAVQSLTDTIASGELSGKINDWVMVISDSFSFISDNLNDLAFETENNSNDMTSSLSSIPDEIRNWLPEIQETFMNVIAWFQRIDDYAVAFGQSLADALDPSKTASITYKNLTKAAEDNYNATVKLNKAEADGIRDRSKARRKEIDDNRKAYEEKRKQEVDLRTLVKNKPGSTSDDGSSSAADKKKTDAAAKLAERQKEQAKSFMDGIARQNEDELKAIDAQEQQKLAKLMEFQQLGAVNAQQYEDTKTAIQLNAETARQEELDKRKKKRDEEAQKGDDFLAQIMGQNATELELYDIQQKQKEDIAKEYRDKGRIDETEYQASLVAIAGNYNKKRVTEYSSMLGTTTDNLRTALGEGNKMYKAFAIANAIMNTYQGAVAAFQSAAAIPIVGWVAAPIAAAAAVAAGLANVAKIRSAREQGGNLAAGQMSTIAERGRAEVIMPAGASRVRTAQQMKQIMGENGGSGAIPNIQIVNQTTGRIDSASTEKMDENNLRLIIRQTVSGDMADSNSEISKTRRGTRGQPGY